MKEHKTMNFTSFRTASRTYARIILGAFGTLAVAGLVTTASAKVTRSRSVTVKNARIEAKQKLPREWRWTRTPINLDGMIRQR